MYKMNFSNYSAIFRLCKSYWHILSVPKCWYGSALYITGTKAKDTFAVLKPYLDFDHRFNDMDELTRNLKLRNIDVNPVELKAMWDKRNEVHEKLDEALAGWDETAKQLWELSKKPGAEAMQLEIERLAQLTKAHRDELKASKMELDKMDEQVIGDLLRLPNKLHPNTPPSEPEIIYEHKAKPDGVQSKSHIEIGEKLNLLDISDLNPNYAYLKGNAALWELKVLNSVTQYLRKVNYVQFSNPDFVRSLIVDGCALNHTNPWRTFLMGTTDETIPVNEDNRLHLVGSSSLAAFCAFLTKQSVKSSLPLRWFNVGKRYHPSCLSPEVRMKSFGFFFPIQASTVDVFIAGSKDYLKMMAEYNAVLSLVIDIYKDLNHHFIVVKTPAPELSLSESFRASVQMYSCFAQRYVEVGHISIYDDYLSKRLLMCYEVHSHKPREFLKLVSGTVVSVPEILACIIENPEGNFSLTEDSQ